jgi:hypothetical protein
MTVPAVDDRPHVICVASLPIAQIFNTSNCIVHEHASGAAVIITIVHPVLSLLLLVQTVAKNRDSRTGKC